MNQNYLFKPYFFGYFIKIILTQKWILKVQQILDLPSQPKTSPNLKFCFMKIALRATDIQWLWMATKQAMESAVEAEHHFLLAYGLHNIKLPLNKPDNAFQSIKMIIDIWLSLSRVLPRHCSEAGASHYWYAWLQFPQCLTVPNFRHSSIFTKDRWDPSIKDVLSFHFFWIALLVVLFHQN